MKKKQIREQPYDKNTLILPRNHLEFRQGIMTTGTGKKVRYATLPNLTEPPLRIK